PLVPDADSLEGTAPDRDLARQVRKRKRPGNGEFAADFAKADAPGGERRVGLVAVGAGLGKFAKPLPGIARRDRRREGMDAGLDRQGHGECRAEPPAFELAPGAGPAERREVVVDETFLVMPVPAAQKGEIEP